MKSYFLVAVVCLLTGCPGPIDPVPPAQSAQARLVNNQVCITVPASRGEKIFSVQFGSESGQEMYKTFSPSEQRNQIARSECLPAFGFEFKPGNTYTVFYQLEKSNTNPGRLFATRFTLEQDKNGRLNLTQH